MLHGLAVTHPIASSLPPPFWLRAGTAGLMGALCKDGRRKEGCRWPSLLPRGCRCRVGGRRDRRGGWRHAHVPGGAVVCSCVAPLPPAATPPPKFWTPRPPRSSAAGVARSSSGRCGRHPHHRHRHRRRRSRRRRRRRRGASRARRAIHPPPARRLPRPSCRGAGAPPGHRVGPRRGHHRRGRRGAAVTASDGRRLHPQR